jgi:hypothetical protein
MKPKTYIALGLTLIVLWLLPAPAHSPLRQIVQGVEGAAAVFLFLLLAIGFEKLWPDKT